MEVRLTGLCFSGSSFLSFLKTALTFAFLLSPGASPHHHDLLTVIKSGLTMMLLRSLGTCLNVPSPDPPPPRVHLSCSRRSRWSPRPCSGAVPWAGETLGPLLALDEAPARLSGKGGTAWGNPVGFKPRGNTTAEGFPLQWTSQHGHSLVLE